MRRTHKSQAEANDKFWSLNLETENALEAFAGLYERFEQSNRDLRGLTQGSRKWRSLW